MNDNELISLLQPVADKLQRVPLPQRQHDPTIVAQQHGLIHGFIFKDNIFYGFQLDAIPLIRKAGDGLRGDNPAYSLGVDGGKFREATAKAVIDVMKAHARGAKVAAAELSSIRASISAWFAKEAVLRHHAIPCAISPHQSSSFTIGPVTFTHVADYVTRTSAGINPAFYEITYGRFLETLKQRYGNWVAEVDVADREESRSQLVADTAVDLAIATLKLILPMQFNAACRTTGRTPPVVRSDFHTTQDGIHGGGVRVEEAGQTLLPTDLVLVLNAHQPTLNAIGHRISAYIRGTAQLMKLEQGWCDAGYWFLEGVAEPFDTIATAKYETSIEVLMRAQSTPGSDQRLRMAFWAFSDATPTTTLGGPDGPTVNKFVRSIVGSRSQVLHGTLSTLLHEADIPRQSAKDIAGALLLAYPLELDAYMASPAPVDEVGEFLDWIHARRYPQSTVPRPT